MLKIVRRKENHKLDGVLRISGFALAIVAAALVVLMLGHNPIIVYREMVVGALGSVYRMAETVSKAIPLLVMGLGVAVCFRLNFSNIGAEGQFFVGATAATWVALNLSFLPSYILLPIMFIVGALAGGLWCLIAAAFKIKWGVNETLVTLMLNYIASKLVAYLQYGPWKDPKAYGFPKIALFEEAACLPKVFGLHAGWIIAIVLTALVYLLINRSKFGYEMSVMGDSMTTAKYAGMNTKKVLLISVLLGGGLCGIAGVIQASGVEHTLSATLSFGLGFTAIVVAWIAKLNPIMIVPSSLFFALLLQGGAYIQSSMQISSSTAEVVQGTIMLFVLAGEFFTRFRFVRVRVTKAANANGKEAAKA